MEELFLGFLNRAIVAGYIILALVLLRPFLKKAPKWITCALWGLVALRLILPFSIESAISLIPSAETVPPESIYQAEPQIQTGFPSLNSAVNPIISEQFGATGFETETVLGAKVFPFEGLVRIFAFIWLAGALLMLLYMAVSWLLLKIRLRNAERCDKGYYLSDKVSSPFIFGLVRPRIYLPLGLSEEDTEHVLAHEKAHLKRKDHLVKPFSFFLLSVYWFHPLLWLCYVLLCRDIEAACDEKVVKGLDTEGKKGYSTALLHCSIDKRKPILAACPLSFGETGVKTRIKSVLSYKKPALWVLIAVTLLSFLLAGCFLTDPASTDFEIDAPTQEALHDLILKKNYNEKRGQNTAFEEHTVFGSEEKNGVYTYYLWVTYEEYSVKNGYLEMVCGSSGPVKIQMELHDEEGFVCESYEVPRDGSYYDDDIRKMVPMKWWSRALNGQNYAEKNSDAIWEKLETWLLSQNIYNYAFKDYDCAYLALKEDGTFSFIPSSKSANYPRGSYTVKEEEQVIVCTAEDGREKYVFQKEGDNLIFVAEKSSALPRYDYDGKSRPCLPDKAVFSAPILRIENENNSVEIDGIAFDIDGDGEKERFSLIYGPTYGRASYYLTMYRGEKQEKFLIYPDCTLYKFEITDGRLYIKGMDKIDGNESFLYEVLYDGRQFGAIQVHQSLLFDLDGDGTDDLCTLENHVFSSALGLQAQFTVETKGRTYKEILPAKLDAPNYYASYQMYLLSGTLHLEKYVKDGQYILYSVSLEDGRIALTEKQL